MKTFVRRGDTETSYVLMTDDDTGESLLEGVFVKWKGNFPSKITITKNSIEGFKILRIDGILSNRCQDSQEECDELQIKGTIKEKGDATVDKKFKIRKLVSLKNTTTWLLNFDPDEVEKKAYKIRKCKKCYDGIIIPEVKKGKVIQPI